MLHTVQAKYTCLLFMVATVYYSSFKGMRITYSDMVMNTRLQLESPTSRALNRALCVCVVCVCVCVYVCVCVCGVDKILW